MRSSQYECSAGNTAIHSLTEDLIEDRGGRIPPLWILMAADNKLYGALAPPQVWM